jgi:acetylornithine deacetylase/succinyl-diaminopimelate desuccinylase-like protein
MDKVLKYLSDNEGRFLEELKEFLRFESVSTQKARQAETDKCADWLAGNMKAAGIENVELIKTKSNSLVYGDYLHAGDDKPTVLVYGHYDVQPEDPVDLWDSPPFKPEVRDGYIYGRGTADDKGQVFTHVKALEAFIQTGENPGVNVKFIIEGEEESGSYAMTDYLMGSTDKISCDAILISDTSWFSEDIASITYGLRGITGLEIKVIGPDRDLHSGTYGGGIENPLNALCYLVSQLHDRYGRVTIPGFYNGIDELTEKEEENFESLPFSDEDYAKDLDVPMTHGEKGYSTLKRISVRPTLDLNGMYGGYTGDGHKSIVPSYAVAKMTMRLVPGQKWEEVQDLAMEHIKRIAPPTVKIEVEAEHGGNPVVAPLDSPGIKAAAIAMEKGFGKKVVFTREGGSIPIVELFQDKLQAPAVMMGFGLDSDNIHSPNEKFKVSHYFGGIKASAIFMDEYSKASK